MRQKKKTPRKENQIASTPRDPRSFAKLDIASYTSIMALSTSIMGIYPAAVKRLAMPARLRLVETMPYVVLTSKLTIRNVLERLVNFFDDV